MNEGDVWSKYEKNLPILICAHHKSGASFSIKTFNAITKEFGLEV